MSQKQKPRQPSKKVEHDAGKALPDPQSSKEEKEFAGSIEAVIPRDKSQKKPDR
jgi:hypothetical protein